MSASLETTNLKLPIYTNQDAIAYIPDWNKAMRTLDTNVEEAIQKGSGNASDIQNLIDLLTAQGDEIHSLTKLLNEKAVKNLPVPDASPGINFTWHGYYTNEVLNANIEISWSPATYDSIIKREYSDVMMQLQACTIPGNPFNIKEGMEDPRNFGVGIVFERNNSETPLPSALTGGYFTMAYVGSVTIFYIILNKFNVNGYRNASGSISDIISAD